jgi:hypothetical protein
MEQRTEELLNKVVEKLNGDPAELAGTMNIAIFAGQNRPMKKWSMLNRFIAALNGASDARSFNAWKAVGRCVKKGEKAFYILAPVLVPKKCDCGGKAGCPKCDGTGKEKDHKILIGFRDQAEFDVAQTDGKPLPEDDVKVPELPLMEVAKMLNIEVKAAEYGLRNAAWGWIDRSATTITLCSPDEQIFFHELSHGVDMTLGEYKKTDYDVGEVVAELSACLLASQYGKSVNLKFTRTYIEQYSGEKNIAMAIGKVFDRVGKIYEKIEEMAKLEAAVA